MNITKCLTIIQMKNRIIAALGNDKIEHKVNITYPQIFVVDLTTQK